MLETGRAVQVLPLESETVYEDPFEAETVITIRFDPVVLMAGEVTLVPFVESPSVLATKLIEPEDGGGGGGGGGGVEVLATEKLID